MIGTRPLSLLSSRTTTTAAPVVAHNTKALIRRRRTVSCSFNFSNTARTSDEMIWKNRNDSSGSIKCLTTTNSLFPSKGKNNSHVDNISNTAASTISHSRTLSTALYEEDDDYDNDEIDNDEDDDSKYTTTSTTFMSEEFVNGCLLLHKIASGTSDDAIAILEAMPSLSNFCDYDRRTPLHVAASEGHIDLCRILVDRYSAKINPIDRWSRSPLDEAQRHRHTKVVHFLTSRNGTFNIDLSSNANNDNEFLRVASEGDLEEMMAIWEFEKLSSSTSSLLNKGDYDHRTALHLAARKGHVDICKFLCINGANINAQDRWGNRPLDDAQEAAAAAVKTKNTTTNNRTIINPAQECVRIIKSYGAKLSGNNSTDNKEFLLELMQQYGKMRDDTTTALTMDWQDAKALLEGVGRDNPTDETVQKLFDIVDSDRDGLITMQEFIKYSATFLRGLPPRIILVVGGPGSGKGVLSERLARECSDMVHLSSGDLLRKEISEGTRLGQKVRDIVEKGGLVSSADMVALMKKAMRNHPGQRILLDGFPRSRENAHDLVRLCGKPELALHIDCDDTVLLERIMKHAENTITFIGGGEIARSDDIFHTALGQIRSFNKYHNVTMDFLREQQVPIVYLDGTTSAQGVWKQLLAIGRIMRSAVKLPINNH